MTAAHLAGHATSRPEDFWGTGVVEDIVLGQPCLVFESRRRDLRDLSLDAQRFPHRDYLVQGDRRVTFAAHSAAVSSVARLLVDRGVRVGDRVMVFGANSIDWVIAFWAIAEVGAVVVLGNGWWSKDELAHALATTTPALVVADDQRQTMLPDGQARMGFAHVAKAIAAPSPDGPSLRPPADEDDPLVIIFTSGTTGLPKGAALSHRCLIATLQGVLERTRRLPRSDAPVPDPSASLVSLPLFHVGGLQQIMTPMVSGGTLVFTEGKFEPERVVQLIDRESIKVWSAVPTMITMVVDYLEAHQHRPLDSLRTIAMGGAPVSEMLRARVPEYFPNVRRGLAVTYGLTEAAGTVATGAGEPIKIRPGSVGEPLATATVRIADADASGSGEILVRAPFIMLGYWPLNDSATGSNDRPIDRERWLHTGDIGRIDATGYLYITDRSKDIVIRGGENIATPHVEGRLLEHPAVREAAVVGLPHATLGEELAAIVVLHPNSDATETELSAFARETLAHFEVPTRWSLRSEPLPQNITGKVLKGQLRHQWIELLAGDQGLTVNAERNLNP